jgi:hypothetical protein
MLQQFVSDCDSLCGHDPNFPFKLYLFFGPSNSGVKERPGFFLRNSRETERGSNQFLIRMAERAPRPLGF